MKLQTSITGVLVTGKSIERFPLAHRAVQAWLQQRYPGDRELLIINDHPTESLYTSDPPAGVREIRIPERFTLGALRNMGIKHASHEYIIQWDDDDFSGSNRLSWQVAHTREGRASIFRYEVHCNLFTGEAFVNDGDIIRCHGFPGTMLWPRATVCQFPDQGTKEDTEFVLNLASVRGVDILDNDPLLYCRFFTGNNTWSEKHIMTRKPGARDLSNDERMYVQQLLTQTQQFLTRP